MSNHPLAFNQSIRSQPSVSNNPLAFSQSISSQPSKPNHPLAFSQSIRSQPSMCNHPLAFNQSIRSQPSMSNHPLPFSQSIGSQVIFCTTSYDPATLRMFREYGTASINDMELCKCRLEACVREIDTWMLQNKLKLNKDKTELLVISSLHRAPPPLSHIHVCDERVLASPRAGNIGVPSTNL